MDADQLLLEWATKEIKPWLEDRVKLYKRWPFDGRYWRDEGDRKLAEMAHMITAATFEHLYNCKPRVYGIPGHEWECGCYSEYTRDDYWVIHAYVTCSHGLFVEMSRQVDSWDMPEVLRQLAEQDEGCVYDDPDY